MASFSVQRYVKKRSSPQNQWVFGPKVGEDQKKRKSLRRKISGFSIQLTIATKQSEKRKVFGGVIVSPQSGDNPGRAAPLPSDATEPNVIFCLRDF